MVKTFTVITIIGCGTASLIAGRLSCSAFTNYASLAAEPMDPGNSISNTLQSQGMDFNFAFGFIFAFMAASIAIAAITIAFKAINGAENSRAYGVDADGFRDF